MQHTSYRVEHGINIIKFLQASKIVNLGLWPCFSWLVLGLVFSGWLVFSTGLLFAQDEVETEEETRSEGRENSDGNVVAAGRGSNDDSVSELASSEDFGLEETRSSLADTGESVLIRGIDISVRGLSSKKIIGNRIGVKIGDEFRNLSELRKVLDLGFDELRSTGYFKRDVGIKYRLVAEEAGTGEQKWIWLEAEFRDAWTVYPIPLPYYSTEEGYGVKGRLKWDNFLGLLTNVTFRADVIQVRGGNYGPDLTGGLNVSTIKITPSFGFNASMYLARDAAVDGANWKLGAGVGLSFDIPLLQSRGISMGYSVSKSTGITFGYIGEQDTQPHLSSSFSHSFGWGKERSSWASVMRDGYYMSLSNSYGFDSDPGNLIDERVLALEELSFNFSMRLSRSYMNAINFKGRVGLGKSFDFENGTYEKSGYNYDVSSYNRGKREDAVKGNFIAYLNMDMAILVFSDDLLGDVLLEPFFDVTWVNNANGFQLEDTSLGSGFELIWIFHSLKFRFTYGIDLHQPELYTLAITTGFYF